MTKINLEKFRQLKKGLAVGFKDKKVFISPPGI